MKAYIYLLLLISATFISCSKNSMLLSECSKLDGTRIIADRNKRDFCDYLEVYVYEGATWTLAECCECDLIDMAFDCENNQLCDLEDDCMIQFHKDAVYQFTVVQK